MTRFAILVAALTLAASVSASAQQRSPVTFFQAGPPAVSLPIITSGAIPTIASGACGTTTNGTVATGSRTNAGTIQIGAAATTVCTVVFAAALPTAPVCVISPANAAASGATVLPYVSANTVNGFVITGAVLANANFNYVCL